MEVYRFSQSSAALQFSILETYLFQSIIAAIRCNQSGTPRRRPQHNDTVDGITCPMYSTEEVHLSNVSERSPSRGSIQCVTGKLISEEYRSASR